MKKKTKLLIVISTEVKDAFQSRCRDQERSMGEVIRSLINAVMDNRIKIGG